VPPAESERSEYKIKDGRVIMQLCGATFCNFMSAALRRGF
jgi:hypothetical protein